MYPHQSESIISWKVFHVWSSAVVLMPSQNAYSCLCQGGLGLISAPLRLHLSLDSLLCAISHSLALSHPSNNYLYFLSEIVFSCPPIVWWVCLPLWLTRFIVGIKLPISIFKLSCTGDFSLWLSSPRLKLSGWFIITLKRPILVSLPLPVEPYWLSWLSPHRLRDDWICVQTAFIAVAVV